jgi:hypothetical protein
VSPAEPSPADAPAAEAPEEAPAATFIRDDPAYAHHFKLKSIGVPLAPLRPKMIDADLGAITSEDGRE